jgi:flavin-binding protein dodecin
MSAQNPTDPIVVGRSPDGFAAAAQDAVAKWEGQRGRPPDDLTTLRVVEMYCTVGPNSFHDYVVALRSR